MSSILGRAFSILSVYAWSPDTDRSDAVWRVSMASLMIVNLSSGTWSHSSKAAMSLPRMSFPGRERR